MSRTARASNNLLASQPAANSGFNDSLKASQTANADALDDSSFDREFTQAQIAAENEKRERIQARIRAEQEAGPPPDMKKRQLIFDSLSKIISRSFGRGSSRSAIMGENRGTYVFSWGAGYHGQLGRQFQRGRKKYATIPKMVHLDVAVRQVSCGSLHTAAVTDAGTLFTWGDARAHQLGYQPHGFTNQPTPHIVESLEGHVFIVAVSCGATHTVALTDRGNLISFGTSRFGQCGHNDRQVVKTPRKLRMDDQSIKFIDVSCGLKHTVALSSRGVCWSFGHAAQGQLGHDEQPPVDKLKPTPIEHLKDVVITQVVCGSIHTGFVSDAGEVYVCGFGENFYPPGADGESAQNFSYVPVKIPFGERVVQIACGQSHILALNEVGDVYAFGNGQYGQLGQGVRGDLHAPRLVLAGKSIAQVAAGRYHSLALTSFGALYSWGCGENGQLGHHSDENVLFPRVIEPAIGTVVGQIKSGEHHTVALSSTPWQRPDATVDAWLRAEQEEFALKTKFLKRTNHGLVKRDLMRIAERMKQIKSEWKEEEKNAQLAEEEEQLKDLASIKERDQILLEIQRERAEQNAQQRRGASADARDRDEENSDRHGQGQQGQYGEENKEEQPQSPMEPRDRPDSATHGKASRYNRAAPPSHPMSATLGGHGGDSIPPLPLAPGSANNALSQSARIHRGSHTARSTFLRESSNMVRRMKSIITESGDIGETSNRLSATINTVYSSRRDYDALRNESRRKIATLKEVQRHVDGIRLSTDSAVDNEKNKDSILKALKMKLSTVIIKITEVEENRRNYALNISHLKEEELERYYQLEALRREVAETEQFARRLNEMKLGAMEERDRSELELDEFRNEISSFQSFIGDQLNKFHEISAIAAARRARREAEKESRARAARERVEGRINRLNLEMDEKQRESLAMAQQLESVNERLRYFEKRFQQVASATGLANPDAIINKFTLKEEMRQELQTEINNKQTLLANLQRELSTLKGDQVKAAEAFVQSKWKDVDELTSQAQAEHAKMIKSKQDAEKAQQKLAYFKEGMLALINLLPEQVVSSEENQAINLAHQGRLEDAQGANGEDEENAINAETLNVLSLLDQKLALLAHLVDEGEERRREREAQQAELKREKEFQHQQKIAADFAEKMKMSSILRRQGQGQTQKNNNEDNESTQQAVVEPEEAPAAAVEAN